VYQGRVPGVHDEWDECQNQVNGFKGNNYKGYKSKAKAKSRYMKHLLGEVRNEEKSNKEQEELEEDHPSLHNVACDCSFVVCDLMC
jgi:ribonuclease HI